ncbi:MAG: hypothetical protein H7Y89_12180 [Steroidobacteraceae bacterium]|nr:hypothetical protein [Steroidobacteraceae bacterium]
MPSDGSAVSWAAVFAGAVGAAAFSLILILLGTGIGLAVVSPWSGDGASAKAIGASTIIWITVVQILASVLGGYLAGRLRSRWLTVHTNEVYFRDTAHGFLAWAVATILMASLLSSAIASTLGMGMKAGGAVVAAAVPAAAGAAAAAMPDDKSPDYYIDMLLRSDAAPAPAAGNPPPATDNTAEVGRIFAHAIATGEMSSADTRHLGQIVAAKTGLAPAEAEKRVTETFTRFKTSIDEAEVKAKKAADDARKASAGTALWLVVSLLIGAFAASMAATFGGRLRDSSVLANP